MSFLIILKATGLKPFWIRCCNNENVFKRDFYPFETFFFVELLLYRYYNCCISILKGEF